MRQSRLKGVRAHDAKTRQWRIIGYLINLKALNVNIVHYRTILLALARVVCAQYNKHVPKEIRNLLKKLLSNTQNQGSHLCNPPLTLNV